jgi:hypothetical protein
MCLTGLEPEIAHQQTPASDPSAQITQHPERYGPPAAAQIRQSRATRFRSGTLPAATET